MVLWLRRSVEQQARLSQFLSQAQNAGSADYRHWLTPDSFGTAYGISDHDLAAVQEWLQSNGLKVEGVTAARNAVLFSGTVGSIGSAFHTSIHRYTVGQQTHFANAADPEVPTALAPVIGGLSPMNDFRARPPPRPWQVRALRCSLLHRLKSAITRRQSRWQLRSVRHSGRRFDHLRHSQSRLQSRRNPDARWKWNHNWNSGLFGAGYGRCAELPDRHFYRPAAASNMPTAILDGAIDPGRHSRRRCRGGSSGRRNCREGLLPGAAIKYYYAASTDLADGLHPRRTARA